jgi:hypothetical protein
MMMAEANRNPNLLPMTRPRRCGEKKVHGERGEGKRHKRPFVERGEGKRHLKGLLPPPDAAWTEK